MREIEYRAWLKDEKKMVIVDAIDFRQKIIFYTEEREIDGEIIDTLQTRKFNEIELMQYVGLKDKNGTKIFEGDIVKHIKGNKYKVVFNNGAFTLLRISLIPNHTTAYYSFSMFVETNELANLEVIGNIYENPELLSEN